MEEKTIGIPYLKRIIKAVDLLNSVESIEDRFLPDGDKQFLSMVIESLSKGQKIQVQKIKAVIRETNNTSSAASTANNLKLQDKENITNLYEMLG